MLRGWCGDDSAIGYVPFFTSLKIDGARQLFVAIQCAARDAWYFFIFDDGPAVLNDGDPSPYQSDIEVLPFSGLAGQFWCWGQETVYSAHVVAGRFFDGISFDLDLVPAAQVYATVGIRVALEFHMQFEILELGIIDQLRAVPGTYQAGALDRPLGRTGSFHPPSRQIFSVEQLSRLAPLR